MNRAIRATLILLLAAVLPQEGRANTGSATFNFSEVVYISPTNFRTVRFYLSNITGSTTTITITMFDGAGNVITDGSTNAVDGSVRTSGTSPTVTNWDESSTTYTASFQLEKRSTADLYFRPSSQTIGYALIEWKQQNPVKSLIGHAYFESSGGVMDWEPINNGQPF